MQKKLLKYRLYFLKKKKEQWKIRLERHVGTLASRQRNMGNGESWVFEQVDEKEARRGKRK